jgi:hypothetical protein
LIGGPKSKSLRLASLAAHPITEPFCGFAVADHDAVVVLCLLFAIDARGPSDQGELDDDDL